MAFWKKKDNESKDKCPLCSTAVSVEDSECPLCFYELKLSPRHQSLNITANEEDSLIGLLNADIEEEEEEIILEVADVIDLDAQEITVDAQYDDDEEDFISISSEHAPEFVTGRMTPSGVAETEDTTTEDAATIDENDDEIDLGGISIPNPPSHKDLEYDEVLIEPEVNETPSLPVELPPLPAPVELPPLPAPVELPPLPAPVELPPLPAPVELPPPPAPVELPPLPAPVELPPPPAPVELPPPPAPVELPPPPAPVELPPPPSPYVVNPPTPISPSSPDNKATLNEGLVWPWPAKEEWDAKNLRVELLEAMAAAKNGDNIKVENTLERIGPHLGSNIELLFHIGILLKIIGRDYELIQMLTKAQVQFPGNSDVLNAVSKLT